MLPIKNRSNEIECLKVKQVAQWETIAHLGASIMFGDTIFYDAQRQVTLLETVIRNKFKQSR